MESILIFWKCDSPSQDLEILKRILEQVISPCARSITILVDNRQWSSCTQAKELERLLHTAYHSAYASLFRNDRPMDDIDVLFVREGDLSRLGHLVRSAIVRYVRLEDQATFCQLFKNISVTRLENLQYNDVASFKYPALSHDSTMTLHSFHHVVLGGAFDHLHVGHKMILTMASMLSSGRIVCGVTEGDMLSKKQLLSDIQSSVDRCSNVTNFLQLVAPFLTIEVVPIQDMYGPTAIDNNLQCLVVSSETEQGANKVNNLRQERHLKSLLIYVVDLIMCDFVKAPNANGSSLLTHVTDGKISSTMLRKILRENGKESKKSTNML